MKPFKTILLPALAIIMSGALLLPATAALALEAPNANSNQPANPGNTAPPPVADFDGKIADFDNLLKIESIPELLLFFLRGFLLIIGVVAVVIITFAGFRMVMSQGNTEAITKAKAAITWSVAGLVVALLSFSLVSILENLLRRNP